MALLFLEKNVSVRSTGLWRRIVGEEGVAALWTGCGPTIGRAMVVNVCQLCCQTQAKEEIAKRTSSKKFWSIPTE